jgi:hypothetical protein
MTVSKGTSGCVGHLNTQFNLRTEWKRELPVLQNVSVFACKIQLASGNPSLYLPEEEL